ncbi:MAG: hypothetical protein LBD28_00715 [Tannerellaceae bacterium]|jgi:hypothetical protein|nr:hypothetical protein [Tannerellaceae bacterium]
MRDENRRFFSLRGRQGLICGKFAPAPSSLDMSGSSGGNAYSQSPTPSSRQASAIHPSPPKFAGEPAKNRNEQKLFLASLFDVAKL